MSDHHRYKLKDAQFGLLAQMLREKVVLTQPEMATVLGVSVRTNRHDKAYDDFRELDEAASSL
jgi:predicted DNA-binding transcriptional regulator YafY